MSVFNDILNQPDEKKAEHNTTAGPVVDEHKGVYGRDEEWYSTLLPEHKWIADTFGLKNQSDFLHMDMTFINGLVNMYIRLQDNPEYKGYALDVALSNSFLRDEDIRNSINKFGYNKLKFNDISQKQWREIYDDYKKAYDEFKVKYPDIPYKSRMRPEFRRKWDETYEGYEQPPVAKEETGMAETDAKEQQQQVVKTPSWSKKTHTKPAVINKAPDKKAEAPIAERSVSPVEELRQPVQEKIQQQPAQPRQTVTAPVQETMQPQQAVATPAQTSGNGEAPNFRKLPQGAQDAFERDAKKRFEESVAGGEASQQVADKTNAGLGGNTLKEVVITTHVEPTAPLDVANIQGKPLSNNASAQPQRVEKMNIDTPSPLAYVKPPVQQPEQPQLVVTTPVLETTKVPQNTGKTVVVNTQEIQDKEGKPEKATSTEGNTEPVGESKPNAKEVTQKLGTKTTDTQTSSTQPTDTKNADIKPAESGTDANSGGEYVPGQFYQQQIEAAEAAKKAEHDNDVKKLKRDAILAGIGDAFNAFHQAYANARGTKPMTTGNMSAKVRERYDKMMQDYRNNKDQFLNARMRAAQMDNEADYKNKMYQLHLDELEEKKKNNEADRKNKDALTKSQIDANNARTLYWEAFADAKRKGATDEEAKTKAELRVKESIVNRNNAAAAASNALEEQRRSDNTSTTQTNITRDERGRETGRTTTTKKRVPTGNGKKTNPMSDNNNNGKKQNPMN